MRYQQLKTGIDYENYKYFKKSTEYSFIFSHGKSLYAGSRKKTLNAKPKLRRMKKILIILFFFPVFTYSQEFKVDCGNDTAFCYGLNDTIIPHIGTEVKITNGIPPFKFSWNCKRFCNAVMCFKASDFLNDTAILNPIIGGSPVSPVRFYLTVTDSTGNKAMDSINVKFSQFIYEAGSYLL